MKKINISKVFCSKLESFVREIKVKMHKMIEKHLPIWYNGRNWGSVPKGENINYCDKSKEVKEWQYHIMVCGKNLLIRI